MVYTRALLKLSGEALAGTQGFGITPEATQPICEEIIKLHRAGAQIAIVLGGGNIYRGLSGLAKGMDRVTGDYMGMLATVINGLALQDVLEKNGVSTRLMSSIPIVELSEPFIRRRAIRYLEEGLIVIFAGGTGNPFFSTDTAASLRAAQIKADVIIKATKVDGVYDCDPMKCPNAVRFDTITFSDVLARSLKVMDATAIAMCRDNNIPIIVYNLNQKDALVRLMNGESVGTIVKEDVDA